MSPKFYIFWFVVVVGLVCRCGWFVAVAFVVLSAVAVVVAEVGAAVTLWLSRRCCYC